MKNHAIQFGQLDELVAELKPGQVVRVVILDISESISSQIPDLRRVSVGVHSRTINAEGHILACYLPVASLQLFNGRREGDPTWQPPPARGLGQGRVPQGTSHHLPGTSRGRKRFCRPPRRRD